MSLAAKRICPICEDPFEPVCEWQVCCSPKCTNVRNVRAYRHRQRYGSGGDDGGPGRQRRLFPHTAAAKAKAAKPEPVAEPMLFETDIHATLAGAVEYLEDREQGGRKTRQRVRELDVVPVIGRRVSSRRPAASVKSHVHSGVAA